MNLKNYSNNDLEKFSNILWMKGWVVLYDLLSDKILKKLEEEAIILKKNIEPGVKSSSVTDSDNEVLVMNSLFSKSEFLYDFARDPEFIRISEILLKKASIPIHCEYFCKPNQDAEATPPHQDQIFYNDHFNDELAITFWCPLNNINLGDGALEYAKIENLMELLPHKQSSSLDFGMELIEHSHFTFTPVQLNRGDCIVHHAYTIHRSEKKVSNSCREAFAFNYRSSSFREDIKKYE